MRQTQQQRKKKRGKKWKVIEGVLGCYVTLLFEDGRKKRKVQFFYENGKLVFRRFPVEVM
jgi:hypothetical protein